MKDLITEEGWPCQRLRIAFSLIMFFFFEIFIGKKLPEAMPYVMLGLGISLLVSAMDAIRKWKVAMRTALVRAALENPARS